MRAGSRDIAVTAVQLVGPLIVLMALAVLAARAPGSGVGFGGGLLLSLAALLHSLIFGAAAARRAAPPLVLRAGMIVGMVLALGGVGFARHPIAAFACEAGLFLVTACGAILVSHLLIGRASGLDEANW